MEPANKAPALYLTRDAVEPWDFSLINAEDECCHCKWRFVSEVVPGVKASEDPDLSQVLTQGLREDDCGRERLLINQ